MPAKAFVPPETPTPIFGVFKNIKNGKNSNETLENDKTTNWIRLIVRGILRLINGIRQLINGVNWLLMAFLCLINSFFGYPWLGFADVSQPVATRC